MPSASTATIVDGTPPIPVCNELRGARRERPVDIRRLVLGQDEGRGVVADDHIDFVDVQGVSESRRETERPGQLIVHLDDHDAVGVGRGAVQLADGRARVQRQAQESVVVGRRGRRRHDPRRELLRDRDESAEVGGDELHPRARVAHRPFRGAEEAAAQTDAGLGEHDVEVEEQRAEHLERLPVVAPAERVQEPAGYAGTEWHRERVGGPEQCGRVRSTELSHGHSG